MTVLWVVWDAAAAWVVDRLVDEGALPAVSGLRARGVRAAARPPQPNCQTAPSLATLFTGTWTDEHGISGFTVPSPRPAAVDDRSSGFQPGLLARPPVWRTLGERGVSASFVHVPWVVDEEGAVPDYVHAAVEAYSDRVVRCALLALTDGEAWSWPVREHTVEVGRRGDDVVITTGCDEHVLAADRSWTPIRLPERTGFWVSRVRTADGGEALVRTGSWRPRAAGSDRAAVALLEDAEVFAGEGVGSLYRAGAFGPRLVDGGDGEAEGTFLGSLSCVAASFRSAVRAVLAAPLPDLVVVYLPLTDDVGHELLGWCDTRSAAYRADVAPQVWDVVRRCYAWADEVIGDVLDAADLDAGDTVLLTADHGIVGSAWLVHPNTVLVGCGLAAAGVDGTVDAASSSVLYHPAGNGALVVNTDDRLHGRVPATAAGDVLRTAMHALLALRAPAGGPEPVVRGFVGELGEPLDPRDVEDTRDVAYLVLADDYQPSAAHHPGQAVRPMLKSASHVVNTGDSRLHATFAAAGPGIPADTDWGTVPNTLPAHLVTTALTADPVAPGLALGEPVGGRR
ncbi:hypothetical protein ASD16_09115 [Cellulomonas sp. Root485]|uniref:alkaline phosphatase family protein n=1 Tax=Cellulomonas sp. Root485 TaxID=1736546 RepID=UPI0006FB9AEE|nr:alkaline phosphatase family protein [Cellulomonas sp. Root485]KQY22774.1 hypothetical protein ASD16_09115 [Cellulomonas sp. Root485]